MPPSPAAALARPSEALSRNQLLEMFYYARLTRDVEERLAILYRQNKVVGGLYRSLGQEGESVAAACALDRRDAVAPLIRNLGAILARGVRPRDLFAQYMAKGASPTRGRDLNTHFSHIPPPDSDDPVIIGPISMLGDLVSVVAGVTLGARMRRRPRVGLTFVGDGATSTGSFHEGMNLAAVLKLPVVVVAEDNKYAYSTPVSLQMAIEHIDQRAEAYGIPHEMVDGNDMLAVYDAVKRAVDRARAGHGPALVGVDTMRMRGHAEHDDMRYVAPDLLERWKAQDPIARYGRWLLDHDIAGEREIDEIAKMTSSCAEQEARLAEAWPLPDPATAARGVWAEDAWFEPRLDLVKSPFANPTTNDQRPGPTTND
jgi:pyruvate dehydrogenase E1 component alpha subunit/2-oxoisovalerate dehydrogenase E1 component alpha subunit